VELEDEDDLTATHKIILPHLIRTAQNAINE